MSQSTPASSARSNTACPHCGGGLNLGATYCAHCARRVLAFELCSECREPIASEARYCPYCAQRVRRGRRPAVGSTPQTLELTVRATRWGSLLGARSLRGFIAPPSIRLSTESIRVRLPVAMGLRTQDRSLKIDDIDTADFTQGAIWSEIVIVMNETGEEIRVGGLRHRDAKAVLFEIR